MSDQSILAHDVTRYVPNARRKIRLANRVRSPKKTFPPTLALEFGTYGSECGRETPRNNFGLFVTESELGRQIRNASKRHWHPQRSDWKEMVVRKSHQVHRQVVEALTFGE